MKILKSDLNMDLIKPLMDKGLNPILLSILNRRGLNTESEIIDFIYPFIENIISPFYFKYITKAYLRIEQAVKNNEKIIIFGDRDVDGATSIVMLYTYLKNLKADVIWEVPSAEDPYGLNINKLDNWINRNIKLCITVDCGISNIEEIKKLKQLNIDTIIIDHHETLEEIPDAFCIVNPKNEESIDFKNIAACGVVFLFIFGYIFFKSRFFDKTTGLIYKDENFFKIISFKNLIKTAESQINSPDEINLNSFDLLYLYSEDNQTENNNINILKPANKITANKKYLNFSNSYSAKISLLSFMFDELKDFEFIKMKFLPLVMIGTMADIMPLQDLNRVFTYNGFDYLKKTLNKNILNLFKKLKIDIEYVTSKDISWQICPVLNAPGRIDDAGIAINFLMSDNEENEILEQIIGINEERKEKVGKAFNFFIDELEENKIFFNNKLTFFYNENIDKGITGITALKLSKAAKCPAIVAVKDGDYYTGSIRGESKSDFVKFLEKGKNIFIQFGGHKKAAGFRFHYDRLDDFKNFLLENSNDFNDVNNDDNIIIDAEIPVNYLNYNLFKIINMIEPFGEKNPNPVLFTPNIKISNYIKIGDNKDHVKIFFNTNSSNLAGLLWNKAEWFEQIYERGIDYNIIYQLEINKFNDNLIPQLIILDLFKK